MKYEHWSSTSTVWRLKVGMCFYTVRFKKAELGLLLSNAVVLPQSEKPNRNGGGDKTAHFQSSKDKAGEKKSWRTEMERSTLWRKMTSTEHKIYFKVVRRDPWRPSVPTGPCRAAFPHPAAFECLRGRDPTISQQPVPVNPQSKSASRCSGGTSCIPIPAHCLLSCP